MQKIAFDYYNQIKSNLMLVFTFGSGMTFFIPLFNGVVNSNIELSLYSYILLAICLISLYIKEFKQSFTYIRAMMQFIDMGIYSSIFVFLLSLFDSFVLGTSFVSSYYYLIVSFVTMIYVNIKLKDFLNFVGNK